VRSSATEPLPLIDGDEHEQRGGEADERMGTEARRAAVIGALKADQASCREGTSQPDGDGDRFRRHVMLSPRSETCLERIEL
jgi:hypothetical protein